MPILFRTFTLSLGVFLMTGCLSQSSTQEDILTYDLKNIPDLATIDSVTSQDGKLKIYSYMQYIGDGMSEYGEIILFRTEDGLQNIAEEQSISAIANGNDYSASLPVEHIYQSTINGKTVYLIQMDEKGSTIHDNSVLAAVTITDNRLVPINVFRKESQDTCIVSN